MAPCFFCLQDSRKFFKSEQDSDLSKKIEPVFVDNLFPLRHLSRFLHLFEDNDNNHDGNNRKISKHSKKTIQFANDSMLSVCEDCSKMMKEFTELYHLMEVTKLRLNWCVQRMSDVMTKTKDKSTFSESENDENLLDVVRTKTMDRMRVMASLPPVPRVVLHKIQKRPRIDKDHPPEQSGSTASPQPQPQLVPPDVGVSITNLVKLLVSKPSEPKSAASRSSTEKRAKSFSKDEEIDDLQQFVKCSHCRAKFNVTVRNTKLNREWRLRQHTLQYHCDVFFAHHKLDTVTDTQFKIILAQLLFKDLIKEKCHFCPVKFQLPVNTKYILWRISKIKSHLVDFHFAELEEILLKIQKDPELPKILEECNPSGKICRCGIYVANKDGEIRHEKFHCVLTKDRPVVETNFEINFIPVPSKMDLDRVSCKLCGREINRSRQSMYSHWTYYCPGGLRRPPARQRPMKTEKHGLPTSCPYCRYECSAKQSFTSMRSHLLRFHPQYYFPHVDYQNQALGVTVTITSDQFQKIIHDILFPELTSSVAGGIHSCPFCPERFKGYNDSGYYSLRRHLVLDHNQEVTDRLEVILKDPDLKRKLEKANPDGVSCPCGMYLPWGEFFRQNHHDKLQCNLKVTSGEMGIADEFSDQDQIPSHFLLSSSSSSSSSSKKRKNDSRESTSASSSSANRLTSCPYCRYVCRAGQASSSMSRHLLRFHPQYYFSQVEVECQVHGNAVTSDQFQRVLHDILFPELTLDLETGGVFSCKFCDYSFKGKDNYSNNSSLRRHLVNCHMNELTEHLKAILADPGGSLEGKLATTNKSGVSCPCGMYLPNGIESYHDKFQCNLKGNERETETVVGVDVDVASSQEMELMQVDYDKDNDNDGGQYQDDSGSESENGNCSEEEEFKFTGETVQMTIDRTVNQMLFVDESDPLEL